MSLEKLMARCVEEGDCMLWTGAMSRGASGSRLPAAHVVREDGTRATMSALRLVWQLDRGRTLASGWRVWRTCRSECCIAPAHLSAGSYKTWGEWLKKSGHNRGNVSRSLANRRGRLKIKTSNGARLNPELANWIMESSQTCTAAAHALGVTPTAVSRVRRGQTWAPLGGLWGAL